MAQSAQTNKRRGITRYIVPHSVHAWFLRAMIGGGLLIATSLGIFMWFYSHQLMTRLERTGIVDSELRAVLLVHTQSLFAISLVSIGICTLVTVLLASFLFHRVAGPIYRLGKHLEQVLEAEESSTLVFRESDQLQDLAELVNRVLYSRTSDTGVHRQSA